MIKKIIILVCLLVVLWFPAIYGRGADVQVQNMENQVDNPNQVSEQKSSSDKIKQLEMEGARNFKIFYFSLTFILLIIAIYSYFRAAKLKKARNILRASEEKFRILSEKAVDVIWTSGLDLKLTYISPSTEQMLGYTRDERMKMPVNQIFSQESVALMNEYIDRNLKLYNKTGKTPEPVVLEFRGSHKDGHEIWVEVTSDFSYNENAKVVGLRGIARNITKRKEAQLEMIKMVENLSRQDEKLRRKNEELIDARKELEKTSEQYFNLFENGPVGYLILNRDGEITEFNSAAKNIIGKNKEQILGSKFLDFVDENTSVFIEKFKNALSQKTIQQHEFLVSGTHVKVVIVAEVISGLNSCRLAIMDISDVMKAEFARKESERKFEGLFNDIPDAIFITGIGDKSGEIMNVNTSAEKQTGYTREELLGMNVLTDISASIITDDLTETREKYLIVDKKIELTEKKRRKDGTLIWTEVMVQKIIIEGKPYALSVSRDITDRVIIQESLKSSESRLRSLLRVIPDLLFVFDKEGRFVEYHSATLENLIVDPDQFLNKKIDDVMPESIALLTRQKIEETLRTSEMQTYDYCHDLPDRKNYFNVRMVKASENNVLSIVRDITETYNVDDIKKQSEEKYKTLFRNTPLGVFNFDKKGVIIDCNENFVRIVGSSRKVLIGFNIIEDAADIELIKAIKEALTKGSGVYEGYYKSVTANKVTPVKGYFKSIYNSHGDFVDGIGIVEDVTGQKVYEKKLLEAKKSAEQSDKLKSSFMATMSHELRTPLNTVIGFSDIIEEGMPIDQILEFTQVISKSGQHLLSIIEDILDISLIDSGEAKLAVERFGISELIDGLYVFASQEKIAFDKDHIEVKIAIPDSIQDVKLSGDIRKIKKIFGHLIKNALKFTHQGRVEIGVKVDNVSGKAENLLFYVKDTGIGIPEDKQQIIFEIFRQADDSTTREFEGTGLGLSISKKLIDMMGGSIWVESIPQRGSTFMFELPCLVTAAKAIDTIYKNNKSEVDTGSGQTVLVAEDDDTNFHLFKLLLNRKKMDVIRARNGKEAVEAFHSDKKISLILMDINMPVMNGYDATKQIKQINKDIPVIAITAYAMAGDKIKAGEAGCDDYITKPINNMIFYETIMKYLD